MRKRTPPGYFADPLCARCAHPLVVHRGRAHDGACAAMRCACVAFTAREPANTWSAS